MKETNNSVAAVILGTETFTLKYTNKEIKEKLGDIKLEDAIVPGAPVIHTYCSESFGALKIGSITKIAKDDEGNVTLSIKMNENCDLDNGCWEPRLSLNPQSNKLELVFC